MSLDKLKPYELGESGSKDALFFLERYLEYGTDYDKRLSASAIRKLATQHKLKKECNKVIPLLIKNLVNPMPLTRQYSLKALLVLDTDDTYIKNIQHVINFDDKEYNIELAKELLKKINTKQNTFTSSQNMYNNNTTTSSKSISNINIESSSFNKQYNKENFYKKKKVNLDEKGYVYIIRESFYGLYKIGKTKNLGERLNLFNVQLPFDIKLVHVIWDRNYGVLEQLLHIHFDEKRENGEWFRLDKEDIDWIRDEGYLNLIDTMFKNN